MSVRPKVLLCDIHDRPWSIAHSLRRTMELLADKYDMVMTNGSTLRDLTTEDPGHLAQYDLVHIQGYPGPKAFWEQTHQVRRCAVTMHAMYELWYPTTDFKELSKEPNLVPGIPKLYPRRRPRWVTKDMFECWDAVCGISQEICATVVQQKLAPAAFWTPDSVDTVQFSPLEVKKSGPLRVGFLGVKNGVWPFSEDWVKGRSFIAEACRLAGLVFDPRLRDVNGLKHHEVPDYLRGLDLYVGFSPYEGCGLPVVEAAACGIPVVMSKFGDWPAMVQHDFTGFLVRERTLEALTEQLIRARDADYGRDRLEWMGQNGRVLAETFWDGAFAARQVDEVWQRMLSVTDSKRKNANGSIGFRPAPGQRVPASWPPAGAPAETEQLLNGELTLDKPLPVPLERDWNTRRGFLGTVGDMRVVVKTSHQSDALNNLGLVNGQDAVTYDPWWVDHSPEKESLYASAAASVEWSDIVRPVAVRDVPGQGVCTVRRWIEGTNLYEHCRDVEEDDWDFDAHMAVLCSSNAARIAVLDYALAMRDRPDVNLLVTDEGLVTIDSDLCLEPFRHPEYCWHWYPSEIMRFFYWVNDTEGWWSEHIDSVQAARRHLGSAISHLCARTLTLRRILVSFLWSRSFLTDAQRRLYVQEFDERMAILTRTRSLRQSLEAWFEIGFRWVFHKGFELRPDTLNPFLEPWSSPS